MAHAVRHVAPAGAVGLHTVRYVVAIMMLVAVPPAVLAWVVIHPLAAFWRRFGLWGTYAILAIPWVACMVGLYRARWLLLGPDLGTNLPVIALGLLCVVAAIAIARSRRRHLTFRILAGGPELSSGPDRGSLLTEGIYGRIRHPRYVEFAVGSLGYVLVANYAHLYLLWVASVLALYGVVLLEERELRDRFGVAYEEYARRVPRFIPRLGGER